MEEFYVIIGFEVFISYMVSVIMVNFEGKGIVVSVNVLMEEGGEFIYC